MNPQNNQHRIKELEHLIPHLESDYKRTPFHDVQLRSHQLSQIEELKLEYSERAGHPYRAKPRNQDDIRRSQDGFCYG